MRISPLPRIRRPRGAFTLIELLTAVAVLIILTLLLANIASQAGNVWAAGESQNQHRQRARAVLDFMSAELSRATLAVNPARLSLQFVINPANNPVIGTDYLNRDAVFWQAPVATDTTAGDLAEVGYFVKWDGNQANLCRLFVNPSDSNYLIYSNPTTWVSDSLLASAAPGDKASQYQGLFLENVLGLWVAAYNADGSAYQGDSRSASNTLPALVRISLALIDANAAKRLQDPASIRNLCASAPTANDFVASLPPPLKKGVSVVENVVYLNQGR